MAETTPSQQAYLDAMAIVAAGDAAVLKDAVAGLTPVRDALDTAIDKITKSRDKYKADGLPTSSNRATVDSHLQQIVSFRQSLDYMITNINGLVNPNMPANPGTPTT